MAAVALVALVRHRDHLDARPATGGEQPVDRLEVRRVLRVADRLEHLDRGDLRELPLDGAVVLERRTSTRRALARKRGLLLGERQPGDARAELVGGHAGERAPAAADLEHVVVRAELEQLAHAPELAACASASVSPSAQIPHE